MKFKNIIKGFVIGLPVTITVVDYFGYVAKVEGVSMQPAFNPKNQHGVNDYVLLNKWSVRRFNVQRGDVVSLISPRDPNQKIIKRIIGLEGDKIKTLNYKEAYVTVPVGHCWVEGDNHGHSMDSNFFGPVAIGLITAKATHVLWPTERCQRVTNKVPFDRRCNVYRKHFTET